MIFSIILIPLTYGATLPEYDIITTDKKIYDQTDYTILITGTLRPSVNGNASEDYGRIISFTLKAPNDRDIDVLGFWTHVDRNGNFSKEIKILDLGLDINRVNKYPTNGIYTIEFDVGNYRHIETNFQYGHYFLNIAVDKKLYNLHDIILIVGGSALESASYSLELINPNGDLSASRNVSSDMYGNFKTSFQIDNLVNLVNGNYTIQVPNILFEHSQVNFQVDNIVETQKTKKPVNIIDQEYSYLDKLMQEIDVSNLKLKFYHNLEIENSNLKRENELLKMQIIDLQSTISEQFKKILDMMQKLNNNSTDSN